ncbi:30S ribosomal protein S15, partial [Haemophilus influenzae]
YYDSKKSSPRILRAFLWGCTR